MVLVARAFCRWPPTCEVCLCLCVCLRDGPSSRSLESWRLRLYDQSGTHTLHIGWFMASGAKNQLLLVNDLGAPTVGDGSVGRWDGKESFFPDGFDVGGHR